eukprot:m.261269 g.261269  ORF g.261269 m.261269 type:complete len:321 (-) comp41780_c0_seq1:458-1420(-)
MSSMHSPPSSPTKGKTFIPVDTKAEPLFQSALTIGLSIGGSNVLIGWMETQPWFVALPGQLNALFWNASNVWPVGFVCVYFVMVMWHLYIRSPEAKVYAKASTNWINPLLVAWNYCLHLLSAWMLVGILRNVPAATANMGVLGLVCDGSSLFHVESYTNMYMLIFMFSKFPELIDTLLLVIRGRHVMFLHWYHHITVLSYCWMVLGKHYPGYVFAGMNAGVHTIMYYYYARMAQHVKPSFGKSLTMIQLAQMLVGVCFAIGFGVLSLGVSPDTCVGSDLLQSDNRQPLIITLVCTATMYGSYFVLFAIFYQQKYTAKKTK